MNKNELIKEAKQCKTQEELIELASKNNINLNNEEANKIMSIILNDGEISDDELENTTGGGCTTTTYNSGSTPKFNVGDLVYTEQYNSVPGTVMEVLAKSEYSSDYYEGEAFAYKVKIHRGYLFHVEGEIITYYEPELCKTK